MPRLDPHEFRARLAYDHAVLMEMSREIIGGVEGYASRADYDLRRPVSPAEADAGRALFYEVTFAFPHLVERGATRSSSTALFDLNVEGSYPYSTPSVTFVRRPYPWTPHVSPATGRVCIGDWWKLAAGQLLAAQLVVFVVRVMNFDLPREKFEAHHNAQAERYWTDELGRRPYLPELRLPLLPLALTHDLAPDVGAFRAAGASAATGEGSAFRPIGEPT